MTDNELLSALSKMIEPLNGEIKEIHKRLDKVDERLDKMDEEIRTVKEQTTQTRLLLENEISQKIDVIGNGHDFLKQRLDNALSIEKYREAMELRIIDHEIRIKELERSKKKEVS